MPKIGPCTIRVDSRTRLHFSLHTQVKPENNIISLTRPDQTHCSLHFVDILDVESAHIGRL